MWKNISKHDWLWRDQNPNQIIICSQYDQRYGLVANEQRQWLTPMLQMTLAFPLSLWS